MAAGSLLKYHEMMGDLNREVYELVAEAAALLQSLRLQGVVSVPVAQNVAPPSGVPERSTPVGANPGGERAAPPVPQPRVSAPVAPRTPAPVEHSPPMRRLQPAEIPVSTPGAGLLGKWGERLVPADERLAKLVNELGPTCESCGLPTLVGKGGLTSGLVLVAAPVGGDSAVMLANMLLKVVLVEVADTWWVHPRGCKACADAVSRQVAAIRPRVVLALGADAASMLGDPAVGSWTKFGNADAVLSWHPDDILADAARKRAVFGHLQEVARRR